ncbi:hypothetical protein [Azospirillum sp. ST 5-10]|uniref:hypothetical protein n=1 Tax=unclassified Azospirillum TaxID=2630922 RepID=UPI003F4A1492
MASRSHGAHARTEIVERGDIYFVFRPKVEQDAPDGPDDVERFYIVLKPHGRSVFRLMVVGRKHLPEIDGHERTWGFVDRIARSSRDVAATFRAETYRTKTRGARHRPAARPAGEGMYAIARTDGDTHLVYALEQPEKPGPVQKAFNLRHDGAFALSVKNPEAGTLHGEAAPYPKTVLRDFDGRRFAEDPHLLDYEGAEFVLIGARGNPGSAYDIDFDAEEQQPGHADVVRALKLGRRDSPAEPLVTGNWA